VRTGIGEVAICINVPYRGDGEQRLFNIMATDGQTRLLVVTG
jgi:hypothetical protein